MDVPVAQWIKRSPAKAEIQVRFLVGTQVGQNIPRGGKIEVFSGGGSASGGRFLVRAPKQGSPAFSKPKGVTREARATLFVLEIGSSLIQ